MGGKCAISEQELRSFFLNRRIDVEPWEIELIASLDMLALTQPEDE